MTSAAGNLGAGVYVTPGVGGGPAPTPPNWRQSAITQVEVEATTTSDVAYVVLLSTSLVFAGAGVLLVWSDIIASCTDGLFNTGRVQFALRLNGGAPFRFGQAESFGQPQASGFLERIAIGAAGAQTIDLLWRVSTGFTARISPTEADGEHASLLLADVLT